MTSHPNKHWLFPRVLESGVTMVTVLDSVIRAEGWGVLLSLAPQLLASVFLPIAPSYAPVLSCGPSSPFSLLVWNMNGGTRSQGDAHILLGMSESKHGKLGCKMTRGSTVDSKFKTRFQKFTNCLLRTLIFSQWDRVKT